MLLSCTFCGLTRWRARAPAALLQGPAIQALALAPAAAPKALAGRLLALLRRPALPAAPGEPGAGPETPASAPSACARPTAPPAPTPAGEAALAHAAQALLAELWPGGGYAALEAPDAAAASVPLSAVGGPACAAAAAAGPALRWLALRGTLAAAAAQRRTGLPAGGGAPAAPSNSAPPRLGDAPAMVLAGLLGHADAHVAAAAAAAAAVAAAAAPLAGIGLLPVLLCQLQARLAGGPMGAARPRTRLWRPAVTWGHAALCFAAARRSRSAKVDWMPEPGRLGAGRRSCLARTQHVPRGRQRRAAKPMARA